jgi:putative ABC transport system permease protein
VSFIIAVPLAYYFGKNWLESFAYHIDLTLWMFVLPGVVLVGITVAIVSIQSYKSAAADPVKSLRHE